MIDPSYSAHVEPEGRFLGWVSREHVHRERLIHLSVNILVFHPDGRLLVQKRHREKTTYPSHWDVSCSGHVDYADFPDGNGHLERDAFSQAAPRELEEELGIKPVLVPLGVYPPQVHIHYERTMVYTAVHPGPFELQATEVEMVRWIESTELDTLKPITPLLKWMARDVIPW